MLFSFPVLFFFYQHHWQGLYIEPSPKTMKTSHWKRCIELELQFDFLVLRELQTAAAISSPLRSQPHFNIHISPLTQCLPPPWEYKWPSKINSNVLSSAYHLLEPQYRLKIISRRPKATCIGAVFSFFSFYLKHDKVRKKKIIVGPNIDTTSILNTLSPPNMKLFPQSTFLCPQNSIAHSANSATCCIKHKPNEITMKLLFLLTKRKDTHLKVIA